MPAPGVIPQLYRYVASNAVFLFTSEGTTPPATTPTPAPRPSQTPTNLLPLLPPSQTPTVLIPEPILSLPTPSELMIFTVPSPPSIPGAPLTGPSIPLIGPPEPVAPGDILRLTGASGFPSPASGTALTPAGRGPIIPPGTPINQLHMPLRATPINFTPEQLMLFVRQQVIEANRAMTLIRAMPEGPERVLALARNRLAIATYAANTYGPTGNPVAFEALPAEVRTFFDLNSVGGARRVVQDGFANINRNFPGGTVNYSPPQSFNVLPAGEGTTGGV